MLLLAMIMVIAATSMIKNNQNYTTGKTSSRSNLFLYGIATGLLTGCLGVGGGFLLVPALVMVVHLPVKKAIGTSLFIIALNSLLGFMGDIGHGGLNWLFLLSITALAITGIFIGNGIGQKLSANKLKKSFGYFIMLMGIYIILKESLAHML
jgi:uncharacterized membrane protein YfcA